MCNVEPTPVTCPPVDTVRQLQGSLAQAGIPSVVGGSGLLAALELVNQVADWDLVTDAEPHQVEQVLRALGFPWRRVEPTGVFRSGALFTVAAVDHEIDVLVQFAVASSTGVVRIPARAGPTWRGLTVAHPEDWETAYRLMHRPQRAELLRRYLGR